MFFYTVTYIVYFVPVIFIPVQPLVQEEQPVKAEQLVAHNIGKPPIWKCKI